MADARIQIQGLEKEPPRTRIHMDVLAVIDAKPRTFRSKAYRDYVAEQPCVISDQHCYGDVVAAHTGIGAERIKASDASCIPLCHHHHFEQHVMGKHSFAEHCSLDYQRICIRLLEDFIMREVPS